MRELFHKFSCKYKDISFEFSVVFCKFVIDTENKHNLICEVGFSYHEMSPEPDICFRVISGKSRFSGIYIHFLENSIDFVICEYTEITIDNPIELSLGMEPKTECIVDSFFLGNVFSPREFNLISVSIDFWRCNNRVKNRRFSLDSNTNSLSYYSSFEYFLVRFLNFYHRRLLRFIPIFLHIMKSLTNLFCFDFQLFFVGDRKPFTSAIYLIMSRKFLFDRGFLYGIQKLGFKVPLFHLKYTKIYDTSRNNSSGNDNLSSIWGYSKSFSSEYEFIDMNIFKNFVFFHENVIVKYTKNRLIDVRAIARTSLK